MKATRETNGVTVHLSSTSAGMSTLAAPIIDIHVKNFHIDT